MTISKITLKKSIKALENNTLSKTLNIQKEINNSLNKKYKKFKIGIVRSFTIETQIDFIKLALSILPANIDLKLSNLNNIEQEVLDLRSRILSWHPDLILILWRIEELIPNIVEDYNNLNLKNVVKLLRQLKLRISKLIKNYKNTSNIPLVVSTLPVSHISNLLLYLLDL